MITRGRDWGQFIPHDSMNDECWFHSMARDLESQKARKLIIYLIRKKTVLTNRETGVLFALSESCVTQSCYRLEKKMQEDLRLSNLIKGPGGELS